MSHYSTLEGYIEILESELNLFKETKLFKNWIDNENAEFSHDKVDYLKEDDEKFRITFGEVNMSPATKKEGVYNRNYSTVIAEDLTALCQKVTYIDIDLLIWSSDGFLTADKYYTDNNKLIVQELRYAPMTTLLTLS